MVERRLTSSRRGVKRRIRLTSSAACTNLSLMHLFCGLLGNPSMSAIVHCHRLLGPQAATACLQASGQSHAVAREAGHRYRGRAWGIEVHGVKPSILGVIRGRNVTYVSLYMYIAVLVSAGYRNRTLFQAPVPPTVHLVKGRPPQSYTFSSAGRRYRTLFHSLVSRPRSIRDLYARVQYRGLSHTLSELHPRLMFGRGI